MVQPRVRPWPTSTPLLPIEFPQHPRPPQTGRLVQVQQLLRAGKAITGLARYFDKNGQVLGRTLDQVEEFDGYSCIFSDTALPKDQLVRPYFDKDLVEKAFVL